MTENEAIGKVRKLFALAARAGTEAEAALAAEKAQAILTEYKLELSRIHARSEAPPPESDRVDETRTPLGKRFGTWQVRLAGAVAQVSYCKLILLPPAWNRSNAAFGFVGRQADRLVAVETYGYLCEQVQRLTRGYQPTGIAITGDEVGLSGQALRKARNAFMLGCAERVALRLREAFSAKQKASAETRALVVTSAREVEARFKALHPDTSKHYARGFASSAPDRRDHYEEGKAAANVVPLGPQRKLGTADRKRLG